MSDESPWQSPSGQEPPKASGSTPPPAPGGATPPPPPPPPPGMPVAPPAWVPPPRPGLIPLAPLALGDILAASFRVLRRNPRPVVGFSLILHLILAVITIGVNVLVTVGALGNYFNTITNASTSGNFTGSDFASAGSSLIVAYGATSITALVTYAADAILQGVITTEVSRATVAEKLPLRVLWAQTRGRVGALLGWAGIIILAVLVVAVVFGGILVLLFAVGGTGGAIAGGVLTFVFIVGLAIVGIWVGTKLSLVPSAIVIERLPVRRAISRSWSLTRGFFWRTFGIELLVGLILGVAASIVEAPISLVVTLVFGLGNPTNLESAGSAFVTASVVSSIVTGVVGALVATITAIISTATYALLYLDLRIRKEGLDLTLMKFMDGRAEGRTDLPDPYATPEAPAAPPPAGAAPAV